MAINKENIISLKILLFFIVILNVFDLHSQAKDSLTNNQEDRFNELAFPNAELNINNNSKNNLSTDTLDFSDIAINDSIKNILPTQSDSTNNGLGIEAQVDYSAKDSILMAMDRTQKVFLYGEAKVKYQDIKLTAACIELNLDSSEVFAYGVTDSAGVSTGLPVFTDKSGSYEMRKIKYNFKTKKAIIEHVVTQQGEGYIVSDKGKKQPDDSFSLKNGHYSTCDIHDHPHFYLNLTKAKVIPGKKVFFGPAYLVVEDVPLPVGIPFGFFPFTSSYSSGVIMPSYGQESGRGLFLRDGGYYWAANEYFDLAVTGDLFTNGSWGIRGSSKYRKRYKFSGNVNFNYIVTINSEKDLPDYSKKRDFSITWSHRQDSKASPYSNFSASVNFSTGSYDKNNVSSVIDVNKLATATKMSSISYSRRFPNSPFNMSSNIMINQNVRDTTINLTAPNLTVSMNRIFPFKRKNKIGNKEAWYEKISFSYSGSLNNRLNTKEYNFSKKHFPTDWENGIKHNIPTSLNLKFLKYFTFTPSFNYTERWYFKKVDKKWDEEKRQVVQNDTTSGFFRVFDYSYSTSTSTKFYTYYKPWKKLFGDKIKAIRHVMTPSLSMSYRPDFGESKYGYYGNLEYYDPRQDTIIKQQYSYFQGGMFGTPGKGKSASLGISVGNTIEMKVKSDKDTTGFKNIKLIEGLNFSTSHNFMADSLKWSNISMSGRTKIFGTSINFGATFDPYALDTTGNGYVKRINASMWKVHNKLVRLTSANLSFGISIGSDKIKQWREKRNSDSEDNDDEDDDEMFDDNSSDMLSRADDLGDPFSNDRNNNDSGSSLDSDGYTKFEIPWNLSINYSLRVQNEEFDKQKMAYKKKIVQDINLNGDFSLTPKWKFSFSSGYSFDRKEIAHTNIRISRDLHCWSMSFNLVPIGTYKSYFFTIKVNSNILRDLKYEKRNSSHY